MVKNRVIEKLLNGLNIKMLMQNSIVQKIGDVEKTIVKDVNKLEGTLWTATKEFLNLGIHFGSEKDGIHLTIGLVLFLIFSLFIAGVILKWIRRFSTRKMNNTDKNKFISVFKFINYLTYIIVFFFVLSQSGINVTPVLAASAALLVGLGLALQDLFQDIIGGIFIILDKSLTVGDVIEVEDKVGRVIEIKLRTTRAITRDDKIIIIPNHILIKNSIYNYTQNRKITRESLTIGVAYGSDVRLVENLLLECSEKHSSVLKTPNAFVTFEDFGDSALIFNLNFFIKESFRAPKMKSDMRFHIDELFRQNNISIPFPQRDVHLFQTNITPNNKEK